MAANVVVKWDDAAFLRAVQESTGAALDAAAETLVDNTRRNLSRQGVGEGRSKNAVKEIERGRALLRDVNAGRTTFASLSRPKQRLFRIAETLARIGNVDPPGGMPRFRSGTLARSITYSRPATDKRNIGPAANVRYARIHEFGGVIEHPGGQPFLIIDGRFVPLGKGKRGMGVTKPYTITMPARPYLRPTLERSRIQIRLVFDAAMKDAMRRRGY